MTSPESYTRYQAVQSAIRAKLRALGRAENSALLVAVSKTHPAGVIKELYESVIADGGSITFGENYIQEFKSKRTELPPALQCHFIGHLQRNKARDAVRMFSVIESVDSVELLRAIQKEAAKEGKQQQIFLQINISRDPGKGGLLAEEVSSVMTTELCNAPNLTLRGLMTITALYEDPELARPDFIEMRRLRDSLLARPDILSLLEGRELELSMGMSSDYLIALEEGATVVRVGSAIFGARQ